MDTTNSNFTADEALGAGDGCSPTVPVKKFITELLPTDVLCSDVEGRHRHPGNEHLRQIVALYSAEYHAAAAAAAAATTPSNQERMQNIAKAIVAQVSQSGRRFLQQVELVDSDDQSREGATIAYVEMEESTVIKKIHRVFCIKRVPIPYKREDGIAVAGMTAGSDLNSSNNGNPQPRDPPIMEDEEMETAASLPFHEQEGEQVAEAFSRDKLPPPASPPMARVSVSVDSPTDMAPRVDEDDAVTPSLSSIANGSLDIHQRQVSPRTSSRVISDAFRHATEMERESRSGPITFAGCNRTAQVGRGASSVLGILHRPQVQTATGAAVNGAIVATIGGYSIRRLTLDGSKTPDELGLHYTTLMQLPPGLATIFPGYKSCTHISLVPKESYAKTMGFHPRDVLCWVVVPGTNEANPCRNVLAPESSRKDIMLFTKDELDAHLRQPRPGSDITLFVARKNATSLHIPESNKQSTQKRPRTEAHPPMPVQGDDAPQSSPKRVCCTRPETLRLRASGSDKPLSVSSHGGGTAPATEQEEPDWSSARQVSERRTFGTQTTTSPLAATPTAPAANSNHVASVVTPRVAPRDLGLAMAANPSGHSVNQLNTADEAFAVLAKAAEAAKSKLQVLRLNCKQLLDEVRQLQSDRNQVDVRMNKSCAFLVSSQETTADVHQGPVYQDLGDEMAMPSLDVDDRWHAFGTFIEQAAAQVDDFCQTQERLKQDVKAWQAKLAKAAEVEKKWREDYKRWEADLLERFLAAKRQMQEP